MGWGALQFAAISRPLQPPLRFRLCAAMLKIIHTQLGCHPQKLSFWHSWAVSNENLGSGCAFLVTKKQ